MNRSLRNLTTGLIAAASLIGGSLAASGTADATVFNGTTGAAADSIAACVTNQATGTRQMLVDVDQYGYNYMTMWIVAPNGSGYWESWSALTGGGFQFRRTVTDYRAAYILFADQTANGQWVYNGEWLVFGNSYWCR